MRDMYAWCKESLSQICVSERNDRQDKELDSRRGEKEMQTDETAINKRLHATSILSPCFLTKGTISLI